MNDDGGWHSDKQYRKLAYLLSENFLAIISDVAALGIPHAPRNATRDICLQCSESDSHSLSFSAAGTCSVK